MKKDSQNENTPFNRLFMMSHRATEFASHIEVVLKCRESSVYIRGYHLGDLYDGAEILLKSGKFPTGLLLDHYTYKGVAYELTARGMVQQFLQAHKEHAPDSPLPFVAIFAASVKEKDLKKEIAYIREKMKVCVVDTESMPFSTISLLPAMRQTPQWSDPRLHLKM